MDGRKDLYLKMSNSAHGGVGLSGGDGRWLGFWEVDVLRLGVKSLVDSQEPLNPYFRMAK